MLKKLLIFLFILIVIFAGIGYYILSNIDSIAKNIIEESGTKASGTDVRVESVRIELKEGKATINNLSVANPPGFSDNPAFRFSEVTAIIELTTGVVKRIYTSQPEIHIEFKGDKSNFDILSRNIRTTSRGSEKDKIEGPRKKAPNKDSVQLRIDQIVVENARATIIRDDGTEPLKLTIERLHFSNLEGSPEQISQVMLGQFVAQVLAETARKTLEKKVQTYIEKKQGEFKDKLGKKLEQLLN